MFQGRPAGRVAERMGSSFLLSAVEAVFERSFHRLSPVRPIAEPYHPGNLVTKYKTKKGRSDHCRSFRSPSPAASELEYGAD